MKSKTDRHFIFYLLLFLGLIVSGYLLFHHLSIVSGKQISSDLCTVLFSRGCNNALFSKYSDFLNVPMGGWGIVYLILIGSYFFLSQHIFSEVRDSMVQTAFWISLIGASGSLFFLIMMIVIPALFCPFCTAFHLINFILFIYLKIKTQKTFRQLFKGLISGIIFIITGNQLKFKFKTIYWVIYLFPLFVGLTIFQWAKMESMKYTINRLAAYDPLQELVNFDELENFEIEIFDDDPIIGVENAPVEMIVFSDFQCEMCQMFATNFSDILDLNKGKLKICYKYFPLNSECNPLLEEGGHSMACYAAYAAEAARLQDRFWEFHDSIYTYNLDNYDYNLFFEIAETMNLDMEKFKNDYESEVCRQNVKRNVDLGVELNLDGTPSVFLNGHLVRNMKPKNLNFLIRYLAY